MEQRVFYMFFAPWSDRLFTKVHNLWKEEEEFLSNCEQVKDLSLNSHVSAVNGMEKIKGYFSWLISKLCPVFGIV